jgi:integrase
MLAPQTIDVLLAARAHADRLGLVSNKVFPTSGSQSGAVNRSVLNEVLMKAMIGLRRKGEHTLHGWRSTFTTVMNEADEINYRVTDMMLAHKAKGASDTAAHYDFAKHLKARQRIANAWAAMLLDGMPSAFALARLPEPEQSPKNVVNLRDAGLPKSEVAS